MKPLSWFWAGLVLAVAFVCGVRGAIVVADFNDCRLGSLQASAGQYADTGVGFVSGYWLGNTSAPRVVTGDLAAPAGTGYTVLAGGTAQALSIQAVSATTRRQQFRSLATPLTGVVWGSVLLQSADVANSQIGLTFNVANIDPQNAGTAGKGRLYASGSSLLLHPWTGSSVTVPGVFSTGTTALVVFRQDIATQSLAVWVSPVLPSFAAELSTATAVYVGTLDLVGSTQQVGTVGLGGALTSTSTGVAGVIDSLRLSDGVNGYYDVTGLAPPLAPSIAVQPVDTLVAPGNATQLVVVATGTAPLSYQWLKDGVAVSGATQATFAILSAAAADAGHYVCVVSNPAGAVTSASVVLSVAAQLEAPTVSVTPASFAVGTGSSATFTATIMGTLPMQLQWMRDGVAIAGATTDTLVLNQLTEQDSGAITLVATNVAGSATSAPATLVVQAPPSFVRTPQDTVGVVGGAASMVAEASGSALTYQWRRGGVDIPGAVLPQLRWTALAPADGGSYTVRVANSVGVIESDPATLALEAVAPEPTGVATVGQDATVENGARADANLNGEGLIVAARSTTGAARKAYLSFALPTAVKVADADSATVRLSLSPSEPYVGGAVSSDGSTLAASADVRIRMASTANQGAAIDLAAGAISGTDAYRTLLTFDLATLNAVSPASVSLRLTIGNKDSTAAGGLQTLSLYRVTGDWSESQASWTKATSIRNWAEPGSDHGATELSAVTLDATAVTVGDVIEFPSTAALRQAVSEAVATDGVLHLVVIASGETSGQRNLFWFYSREDAGREPSLVFPPGSVGNASSTLVGNPVRVQLHGVVDNSDTWSEGAITWANAPRNAINSATALGRGTALLAEAVVDSATLAGGGVVEFSDRRVAQFLNWAAGRRGDLYGTGAQSDADRNVTVVLTVLDAGSAYPGLKFVDREGGGGDAPQLGFATMTMAATDSTSLENERYRMVLRADRTVEILEKASGASQIFSATFDVLSQAATPSLGLSNDITGTVYGTSSSQLNFSVPAWGGNPNYGAAPGVHHTMTPNAVRTGDGAFMWTYPTTGGFSLRARVDLPAGTDAPRLRWTLEPWSRAYFSVAYVGAPALADSVVAQFFLPGIWSERRFQSQMYLIDEVRATLPAVLVQVGATVGGVAVDPIEIPNRISTAASSLFALTARNASSNTQATVLAPLYGTVQSNTDACLHFTVRLIVAPGTVDTVFREVATGLYGFRDYRRNLAGGSLNQTLDNLEDFVLNTSGENYSYWMANEKANDYVNDKPGYARFQSAPTALGLAMVRDSATLYETRAKPSIEYFISRERSLFKIGAEDPEYPMGGPVSGYRSTDWFALSALSGRRTPAYERLAEESLGSAKTLREQVDAAQPQSREQALDNSFNYLRSLLQAYRTTADAEYLADAQAITDAYITYRLDMPAADFRDVRSSFWNNLSPAWETLLEMQELTGSARYGAAAVKAMDQFVRHLNFAPAINDYSVDAAGVVLPTRLVSEVGLPSEAAATSSSHRGIYVPYPAAALLRVAQLSQNPFYAAVGKANLIGRYLNYPGYTLRNSYNAAFLQANYPLRFYSAYQNSGHMNHPLPQAAMIVDYLMADAEYRSNRAIVFPHQFTDSGGYFRGRLYGQAPGQFYGDTEVWPWLPRALVTLSGPDAVQLNYIAGRGNGRLYLAFANQSSAPVVATVSLDAARVSIIPSARVRVWQDNVAQADGNFVNGVTTISVSPGGFTALAIDEAVVQLSLQSDYQEGSRVPMPASSYDDQELPGWGKVVGTVLSLSPQRQHAYVYATAGAAAGVGSATLHYRIDGGAEQTLTKSTYPFEFSVPLDATTQTFAYWLTETSGAIPASAEVRLELTSGPIFLARPPSVVTTSAGNSLTLDVTVEGDGPFTYQWRKDGLPIAGATTSTLTFTALVEDSGVYDVVVVGPGGMSVGGRSQVAVVPATAAVSVDDSLRSYTGSPITTPASTTPAGLAVQVTYNGQSTAPTWPGDYAVVAAVADPNFTGSASGVLSIRPLVTVRHMPVLNGAVDGSVHVLTAEAITLNSQARLTTDLLVAGTPAIRLNGSPTYAGVVDANGEAYPATQVVTLNSGAQMGRVVRRSPSRTLVTVSEPSAPLGTRTVGLNQAGQSAGDFSTLLDLTLNSGVGDVAVPAGRYRRFTVNQDSSLVLGTEGSTTPALYELGSLVVNQGASVRLAGPVILRVGAGLAVNGAIGEAAHPEWLVLQVFSGGLTLNGGSAVSGDVLAPNGTVTVNSASTLRGRVEADKVVVNGSGLIWGEPR